jgi:hypothetical protein
MIITLLVSLAVVVVGIVVLFATMPNNSSCTGDCNQGRNCTCRNQ